MIGVKYRWDFKFIKAPQTYSINEKYLCNTKKHDKKENVIFNHEYKQVNFLINIMGAIVD